MARHEYAVPGPLDTRREGFGKIREKGEKTLSCQKLMADSHFTMPEYDRQRSLMKKRPYFSSLMLIGLIMLAADIFGSRHPPDVEIPEGQNISFEPIEMKITREGWEVAGAWRILSPDPRVAGLSGLDVEGGRLVAITDSARRLDFDPPPRSGGTQTLRIRDIHSMSDASLANHDTESIAVTTDGSWISFEMRHRLLKFETGDIVAQDHLKIHANWPRNRGAEALVAPWGEQGLLVLAEGGQKGLQLQDGILRPLVVEGATGSITGAARLADGRIAILTRKLDARGLRAFVALAKLEGSTLAIGRPVRIPTGPMTNVEGLAAMPTANGDRLFAVSDNNGLRWLGQTLVAIDVAADAWPEMP